MQQHGDSVVHFSLATLWLCMVALIEWFGDSSHVLISLSIVAAVLQIAYLIRKHVHFRK